ncbi:MAG: hypothetical protein K2L22_02950 [Muribaculaceae bacterium]|nr:hypothetical protein [Muribaculaceae bacterium]
MKKTLIKSIAIIFLLASIFSLSLDLHCFKIQIKDGMKVYSNAFTHIIIDPDLSKVQIYDIDTHPHYPVLSREYWRGDFILKHIQDDFYSLYNEDLPGEKCIDNMNVYMIPDESAYVTARLKLGNSTNRYIVTAESIGTDSNFSIVYPLEDELRLPVNRLGYRFSIRPQYNDIISIAGIAYGFSPTLKYLDLRDLKSDLFSSGGYLEISLPYFEDTIFDKWCINGDILQIVPEITNDKIIWHGKEFRLYDSGKTFFNF